MRRKLFQEWGGVDPLNEDSTENYEILPFAAEIDSEAADSENAVATGVSGYTGLREDANGNWHYYENDQVASSYTGFAQNQYGWWYVEKGNVSFSTNSVIQDTKKKIDGADGWWYVVNGKVQTSFTGLANYGNAYGWWYIKNGKVDFSVTTVAENSYGWWCVESGKVNFRTGFAQNQWGWWYVSAGKVSFSTNSVIQGTVNGTNAWWYVEGGKVQTSYTGVANYENPYGWWYIKNGRVDFSVNTIAENRYGWWYVKSGKVIFSYTGAAQNQYGWWYIKNGKVDFNIGTVVLTGSEWLYYSGGTVNRSYTGVAPNEYGWWYCVNGKVIFDDALTYAAQFVGANSSTSQSNSSKLASCYNVLWSTYSYVRTYGDNPSASVMSQYAIDMFKNKRGNCYRYAASFACIAKVLGYDSRVACGMISSVNGGMTPHAWTEVYMDGQWLICDPDMQMNYPNINSYMRTESNYAYKHTCSARYTLKVSGGKAVWS